MFEQRNWVGKRVDKTGKKPTLELSRKGAQFLAAWEGYRANPYNDSENNATIGIGHLIHYGPVTPADEKRWGTISFAHATLLAQADVYPNAIEPMKENLKVTLTVPQIDTLCSIGFNCGPGALAHGSAIMRAVNSKPHFWNVRKIAAWHIEVGNAIMLWAHPAELYRRRMSEVVLFNSGKYFRPGNTYSNA